MAMIGVVENRAPATPLCRRCRDSCCNTMAIFVPKTVASTIAGQRRKDACRWRPGWGRPLSRGSITRDAAARRSVADCRGVIASERRTARASKAPKTPQHRDPTIAISPSRCPCRICPWMLSGSDGGGICWATSRTARVIRASPSHCCRLGISASSRIPAVLVRAGLAASRVIARRVPSRRRAMKYRVSPRAIPIIPLSSRSRKGPTGGPSMGCGSPRSASRGSWMHSASRFLSRLS